jgi:hypothetical protein
MTTATLGCSTTTRGQKSTGSRSMDRRRGAHGRGEVHGGPGPRQGWDKRRAPGYRPFPMAGWARAYRARRKARWEQGEAPAEE